jgi:hypothetical protein
VIGAALLALAGCGSDEEKDAGISDTATCVEWTSLTGAAGQKERDAYVAAKGYTGADGEIMRGWIDNLCGWNGAPTPFSEETTLTDVFPSAKARYDQAQVPPPLPKG